MATGPEGSAYEEDGKRYQAALAKAGVEVQLFAKLSGRVAQIGFVLPKADFGCQFRLMLAKLV